MPRFIKKSETWYQDLIVDIYRPIPRKGAPYLTIKIKRSVRMMMFQSHARTQAARRAHLRKVN